MKPEVKNLYLAVILSIAAIFITNLIFPAAEVKTTDEQVVSIEQTPKAEVIINAAPLSVEDATNIDKRIKIANADLNGSIRLKGARFDSLNLSKYKQNINPDSGDVELLTPNGTKTPYFADFGWISSDNSVKTPTAETIWKTRSNELTPNAPIILEWNNGQGIRFIRKISLDKNYMFNIEQTAENNTNKNIHLYPYGLINKTKSAKKSKNSVVHEGFTGVLNSKLKEITLTSLDDEEKEQFQTKGGWAGFSDRYWFSALVLDQNKNYKLKFSNQSDNKFQVDYVGEIVSIPAGSVGVNNIDFYAGAKEIKILDHYTKNNHIEKFDLAVDFGWYYFLTKPFFYILDYLYNHIGNMGWAILLFAALLRFAMFPIANKSYTSMSKMKKVQPKVKELQEKYSEDKTKLQQEMMELYRKEKINPASGCLPMLIQIPVFFSLYKVLNIAIEIRQAPFIGWIKDLSAPDPMTISAMTSLPIPSLLDIGVWPIMMGITMFVQQKLNPAPTNKDQARMFAMMPIIFTFMLGHFASGLVIYWTLSNILSIVQQKIIMRKVGV